MTVQTIHADGASADPPVLDRMRRRLVLAERWGSAATKRAAQLHECVECAQSLNQHLMDELEEVQAEVRDLRKRLGRHETDCRGK